MKRFGLALAVGFVAVCAAPAQQPNPAAAQTGPAATTGTPIVTSGTIVQGGVITTTPARRGLFGRRNRNNSSAPVITSYPTTGTTIPMPATTVTPNTTIPNPMPSTAPAPRTGGTSMIVPNTGIVQAGGTIVTTDGSVVTTSNLVPANTTTQGRNGVIARIRARR